MGVKTKHIDIKYQEFDSIKDLTSEEQEYVKQAIEIRKKAHAIYSKFEVGAVVVFEDGEIVLGNNQENIASPAGLCAERVALNYAKANYPDKKITHLVVVGAIKGEESDEPITPCGECCQVISETEGRNEEEIIFILASTRGKILRMVGSKNLLPFAFHEDKLGQNEK